MSACPHIDLLSPDTFRGGQPREVYSYLRNEAPVYWHEGNDIYPGFWVLTRRADVDYVSKNHKLFSSYERTCMLHEPASEDDLAMMRMLMINMDPPQHLKYRRLVRNAFTPAKVESYRPRFEAIARDLVTRAVEGGKCEFVEDVAMELPLLAICELMGVPARAAPAPVRTHQYHARHG